MAAPTTKVWLAHQLARRAAKEFLEACERAGIRALLVKGVILGVEAYDDVVQRPISDVDVLVRPWDFPRIVAVARREGWSRTWDSKLPGVVNITVQGVFCDVAAFVGPIGTTPLSVGDLIERAKPTDRDFGFPHLRIELHDHTLVMAIDVFKDKFGWAEAKAREDLVRLALRPSFDPEILLARARHARLETMLWIVAGWVLSETASAPWEFVRQRLEQRPLRRRYAARYLARASESTASSYPWRAALTTRMVSDVGWRRVLSLVGGAAGLAAYLARGQRVAPIAPPGRSTDE